MSLGPGEAQGYILESRRYDGTVHMRWAGELVVSRPDLVAVRSAPGTRVEHRTRQMRYSLEHWCVAVFPAGEGYNVMADFAPHGQALRAYVNVADSVVITDGAVSWKDLWVDVIFAPGAAPEIVDENELTAACTAGLVSWTTVERVLDLAHSVAESDASIFRPSTMDSYLCALTTGALHVW